MGVTVGTVGVTVGALVGVPVVLPPDGSVADGFVADGFTVADGWVTLDAAVATLIAGAGGVVVAEVVAGALAVGVTSPGATDDSVGELVGVGEPVGVGERVPVFRAEVSLGLMEPPNASAAVTEATVANAMPAPIHERGESRGSMCASRGERSATGPGRPWHKDAPAPRDTRDEGVLGQW